MNASCRLLLVVLLRRRPSQFCKYAKLNLNNVAKKSLQSGETFFAFGQRHYFRRAIQDLQNGLTGSLFSRSVIKGSFQEVSLEQPTAPIFSEGVAK